MAKEEGSQNAPHRLQLAPTLAGLGSMLLIGLVWFAIAGRADWWPGWIFLLAFIFYVSILLWRLSKMNPALLRERNQPSEKAEAWDQALMRIYTLVLLLLLALAALDSGRFGWSVVPLAAQVLGWLLMVVAAAMIWQVMMTNTFLSSWARIQEDRGQVVIQDGLYRHIRHPMYLAIMLAFAGMPLALASYWALIPAALIIAIFIIRTHREDQMLLEGLDGYADYASQVRARLIPGIW